TSRPVQNHPAHHDRQRRQRPDGALCAVRGPAPAHPWLRADHLSRLWPRRHFPVPRQVRPRRRRIPRPLTTPCEGANIVATTRPSAKKPLSSSIALWFRTDHHFSQGLVYLKASDSPI